MVKLYSAQMLTSIFFLASLPSAAVSVPPWKALHVSEAYSMREEEGGSNW